MNARASIGLLAAVCVALGVIRGDLVSVSGIAKKRVDLNFWNGFTGPDGVVMLQLVRQFNEANPDVQVSMQRMDWGTYYNKLMVAVLDHRGPEVFVLQANSLPRMHRAHLMGEVNSAFGQGGIPTSDFDEKVFRQVVYGKEYVGVPLDIWPFGLYCNKDMLKRASMVDANGEPRAPKNQEEFLRLARSLRVDTDHDGLSDLWGYALTDWRIVFQSLQTQFGGHYFDDKGRADLVNEGNIKTLEFMTSLNDPKDRLAPPPENGLGWMGFRQQKVGMVIEGIYMLGDLKRLNDFHYLGAPLPVIGNQPGTLADSHILCIRNTLSSEQKEGALRFLKFLSANSIQWAGAGQVPARKSVRATDEFKKMQVQHAFSLQIPYIHYFPRTVNIFELNQELGLAIEQVIRGRKTPKDALTFANKKIQESLDRTARDAAEQEAK
jgi:multiple sugar transport system substrate-binding protein